MRGSKSRQLTESAAARPQRHGPGCESSAPSYTNKWPLEVSVPQQRKVVGIERKIKRVTQTSAHTHSHKHTHAHILASLLPFSAQAKVAAVLTSLSSCRSYFILLLEMWKKKKKKKPSTAFKCSSSRRLRAPHCCCLSVFLHFPANLIEEFTETLGVTI